MTPWAKGRWDRGLCLIYPSSWPDCTKLPSHNVGIIISSQPHRIVIIIKVCEVFTQYGDEHRQKPINKIQQCCRLSPQSNCSNYFPHLSLPWENTRLQDFSSPTDVKLAMQLSMGAARVFITKVALQENLRTYLMYVFYLHTVWTLAPSSLNTLQE